MHNIMEVVKDKKKPIIPKIVICPDWKSLSMVKVEFISAFGSMCIGVCLLTLEEAIESKLPIKKAQLDYANKIPGPVYLCAGVDELIPDDYIEPENPSIVTDVVLHWMNNPRKMPDRNDTCLCGSGKKYKKCCITL